MAEAFRQGSRGAAWDVRLALRPWGFRLEEVAFPVHVWQGQEDVMAPAAMGRYLARAFPNCRATFLAGKGHFLFDEHKEEIVRTMFA